jgi:hypothetical protein
MKNKKKKTTQADKKKSSMLYQPIQRNLVFTEEFSGGDTARVNGVPPPSPNISDHGRTGHA